MRDDNEAVGGKVGFKLKMLFSYIQCNGCQPEKLHDTVAKFPLVVCCRGKKEQKKKVWQHTPLSVPSTLLEL